MRSTTITKILGVAMLLGMSLGPSPAPAGEDCQLACETQWAQEQQACLETYDQTLADLDLRASECLTLPPSEQDACTKAVERERKQAKGDYKNCLAKARVDYNHCRQDCSTSPSTP